MLLALNKNAIYTRFYLKSIKRESILISDINIDKKIIMYNYQEKREKIQSVTKLMEVSKKKTLVKS